MKKVIYLDNASTTPLDKESAEKAINFCIEKYANPSSHSSLGEEVKKEIEDARKKIADFINSEPEEIIFTSGATESINFALKGLASAYPEKNQIITSEIEHPAVLETCRFLEKHGFKIEYIPVNKEGIVSIKDIKDKISEKTLVVSIMHVNNEIGTIQPIEEIAELCNKKNVFFHTDAVQSFAKLPIDIKKMKIDLMSVSGHKINAPKGIGFLYKRKGIKLEPLMHGGGQEKNLRSGTENVFGILSLAEVLKIKRNNEKIKLRRDYLIKEILKIPGARLNGSLEKRIYSNISVSFYGIEGESIMMLLQDEGIIVSTGSACSSHKLQESHVLKAIKVPELYINGSIRISLDVLSKQEADFVIEKFKSVVEKLRRISPFKFQEVK